jgi:hypothetical protein
LAPLTLPDEELRQRALRFAALLALFGGLWTWLAKQQTGEKREGAPSTTAPLYFSAVGLWQIMKFAAIATLGGLAGLAIEAVFARQPLLAAKLLRYYWFRQADFAVPLAVALAMTALVADQLKKMKNLPRGADHAVSMTDGARLLRFLLALAPVAWASWYMIATVHARRSAPPPADLRIADLGEWTAACDWVRKNTPPDSLFLVPRHAQSFKWYAHRGDVVNWKDIPQDAAGLVAWRQRVRDNFESTGEEGEAIVIGTPERLGTRRVRWLAEKYGADYVIGRQYPPLNLPRLYPTRDHPNTWYAVYSTDSQRTNSGAGDATAPAEIE